MYNVIFPELVILAKIILSTACGWLLGKERKAHDKDCGRRTMSLLCLFACLISILSLKISQQGYAFDFVRLISYSLPAIGFIGMAVIHKEDKHVDGLTTATSLISILPIGFFIGLGFYFEAIMAFIIIYFLLESKYWFKHEE